MPFLDPAFVLRSLKLLENRRRPVFGAADPRFLLNPVLSEAEVKSFEIRHSVKLPPDYRSFLLTIGDGGAGPYYGVFPLGKMDDGLDLKSWKEDGGFIGTLAKPFPLKEPWNDLSTRPSGELRKTNEEEYERQLEEFEKVYWNPELLNGAIPLCHMGCALRVWLIVSGERAGSLWRDGRTDDTGLSPIFTRDQRPATFSSWYLDWLQDPESMR
jgi:SMI1 / KNR4 family (SUKH-1)